MFIDAGHVRAQFDRAGLDWGTAHPVHIAHLGLTATTPNMAWRVVRVLVYDALRAEETERDPKVQQWLDRCDALATCHVRLGMVAGAVDKKQERWTQKRVDVQIAVDALTAAFRGHFDIGVLVCSDNDFAPLAEAIRSAGPWVAVAKMEGAPEAKQLRREVDFWGEIPLVRAAAGSWD